MRKEKNDHRNKTSRFCLDLVDGGMKGCGHITAREGHCQAKPKKSKKMVTFILLVIFSSQDFILATYSGQKIRTRRNERFTQLKGSTYDMLLLPHTRLYSW